MHNLYEERFKHRADFRVTYRFYRPTEGGRKTIPHQGIRTDFWYHHKDNVENSLFMIYPEFEDDNKNVILENDKPVPESGTARMWILMTPMRKYHKGRIKIGTIGYFMEGPNKIAECEVIEIIALLENPTE